MDNKNISIEFVKYLMQLPPPKYSCDVRRRFIPQVPIYNENEELLFIDNLNFNHSEPIFYTTEQLFEKFINENKTT